MNIVTSVKVYPQGGTVETVSQKKKKFHLLLPWKRLKILSDDQSPFKWKGIKR